MTPKEQIREALEGIRMAVASDHVHPAVRLGVNQRVGHLLALLDTLTVLDPEQTEKVRRLIISPQNGIVLTPDAAEALALLSEPADG